MFDGLHAERGGEMGLSSARSTNCMLTDDLAFRYDDQLAGINAQADRPVCK